MGNATAKGWRGCCERRQQALGRNGKAVRKAIVGLELSESVEGTTGDHPRPDRFALSRSTPVGLARPRPSATSGNEEQDGWPRIVEFTGKREDFERDAVRFAAIVDGHPTWCVIAAETITAGERPRSNAVDLECLTPGSIDGGCGKAEDRENCPE